MYSKVINLEDCKPWGKYGAVTDLPDFPTNARPILFEDGLELDMGRCDPWKVGRFGLGGYSYTEGKLYFSASDRLNCLENGREYRLEEGPHYIDSEERIFPTDVGIEITNICNARCCYCPLYQDNENALKYPLGSMDMKLFCKTIDEISLWPGWVQIYLNNGGEPLLDPYFSERIRYCYRKGVSNRIVIQTNAELLTEEKSRICLENGIGYIFAAFDGATKETYEKHRVQCHFEKVLSNIKRFAQMRDKGDYGTSIQIKFMRTHLNEAELIDTYNLFNEFLSPELDHFQEEYAHTWNETHLKEAGVAITNINSSYLVRECRMAYTYLPIFRNGDIGACCLDYNNEVMGKPFGNVSKDRIIDVYNGRSFNKLRRAMHRVKKIKVPNKGAGKKVLRHMGLPEKCMDCYLMYYKEGDIDNLLPDELLYCKAGFSSYIYKFTGGGKMEV